MQQTLVETPRREAPPGPAHEVDRYGREPSPGQHSLRRSVFLHLAPGAALTAFVLVAAPVARDWGFPAIFALFAGIALVIVPLELGYLMLEARRRTGRWSPMAVIPYRNRLRPRTMVLATAALAGWFTVVLAVSVTLLDERIADTLFAWVPETIREFAAFEDDGATYTTWALVVLFAVAFLFNGFVGPVVEELYFRGHLLPGIDRLGARAPVLNAVLFSLYHFWTPWQNLGRIVALLPWTFAVWRTRSVALSIAVHVTVNVTFLLLVLAVFL
jgi:membrane protease YdiL (CAAX protease family)